MAPDTTDVVGYQLNAYSRASSLDEGGDDQEEDSCEAVADEHESVVDSDEVNEGDQKVRRYAA